ncbi:16S rRNA (guanine(966)-N(2))-methyltransferase RsmD [Ornithinimicrobium pratense]|uniref:16S rRNA (Guanine(966)-N(2))-methyltransferase RsmD n=1 Tax=Ornithinimicrobium pratense TaxID=2593973 RepID=A0A5J6V7D7_9MICO|nr:16S rRNA (guanine(966)-N(2))-methyltransferase RsmD [Ornithinimicrobium pratense]QFG68993.1 16S rRNA (guanine(966)-N(2))-methyltransferase RsmD [Ornithinimicrobium pratense]
MTRIIAGTAGGRTIRTPRGRDTRPTTDRVREALFSRVEALLDLDGARVLDLYAGSGALGLEALSRGAQALLAVERHRPTARLVEQNADLLGFAGQVGVHAGGVERLLALGPDGAVYDLVLADPPYPLGEEELTRTLQALVLHGWLAPDALIVVERSSRSPRPTWPPGLEHLDTRAYGEAALHLAEPIAPGDGAAG